MKIVFLDRSTLGEDISIEKFNALGEVVSYDITTPNETLSRIKDADVVVTNKVIISKEMMQQSQLKLICVAATGMNNIDLEYAKQSNIAVKNVAGYSTNSVAQLTFSLVLKFMQHLDFYDNYVKEGNWQKSPIFTNIDKPFHELEGKSWGIIGLGSIGQKVASIATAFDCKVSYYSTSGLNTNSTYEQKSLEALLSSCDIISIHSPLNEKTLNLLNKNNMNLLKEKAIVINVGRGGIINEADLAYIIDSKEIYFGMDVASKEPIAEDSPMLHIKNKERLVLTPHIAWASIEARERLVEGIYNNIVEFSKN
ncbi:MAG: D-2-hydroxyacid dehydrogenase [Arcobacteraceae bacterium]